MTQVKSQSLHQVRMARRDDVGDLVRMRLALQAHSARANPHLLAMSAQRIASLARFYHALLEDPAAHVLVAFDPGATCTVGMAIGRILHLQGLEPPECGRIDDVWVEPEHRGHGVCHALMAQLVVFFERARIEVVTLDYTVGNHEAEQVWSCLGFEPVLLVANAKLEEMKRRLGSSAP